MGRLFTNTLVIFTVTGNGYIPVKAAANDKWCLMCGIISLKQPQRWGVSNKDKVEFEGNGLSVTGR